MSQLEIDECCVVLEDYVWHFPKSIRPFQPLKSTSNAADSSEYHFPSRILGKRKNLNNLKKSKIR